MNHRHGLLVVAAMVCAATAVHAQYVEDSIDVGGSWVGSLAYNSREDVLYGRCQQAGIFFAISCDSNKVISSFPLSRPRQMTYDSTDNKAYCPYEGADGESLAVIDGQSHTLVKRIGMPGATTAVWDPVSDRLYVSCQSTNTVAVVDCATDSVLTFVPVGACPMKMYINTLRRKLYVLNYDDGAVSIVNMETNEVINTLVVGGEPNAGYYCRSADKFYSGGEFRQCVVISGESDTSVVRITLPGNVDIVSAAGNEKYGLIYLGTLGGGSDYVATVSAQVDSVLATTVIGAEPWGLSYFGRSGLLYCASAITDEVRVLTGDGTRILTTLRVGNDPYAFAQAPDRGRLYLGHLGCHYVYVLRDTTTGAVAEPQSPRPEYRGVSVTPNPFSRRVAVAWSPLVRGDDVARVYAQDGRLVRQARIPAGEARWVWDGRDDAGGRLPPGVYVIEAGPGLRAKVVKLK